MEIYPISFKKNCQYEIICPICGFNYQHHFSKASVKYGKDNYEAQAHVRGDVISIPFSGECGHVWELCLGFHKGDTFVFVRTEDVNVGGCVSLR